ncbi:MAG: hypothetical protein K0S65_1988 [Labilithrix sp.]|nr:hypothetical protein [Labilithrix sp.]
MIRRRFVASALLVVAVSLELGCSDAGTNANIESSDDSYASVANGLWVLDGDAEHGDIELLQLDRRAYASVVRQDAVAVASASTTETPQGGLGRAGNASTTQASRASTGNVARASANAAAPTISLIAGDEQLTAAENGNTLTLTGADGRTLTYRRSYRLYCVPTDRGVEATVLLELGKEPELVGVNGDGRSFPKAGSYPAKVRTDVLFRLHDYELLSTAGTSTVTVKLPWEEMTKPEVHGTLAIVGPPDAALPTPITCERVATPTYR